MLISEGKATTAESTSYFLLQIWGGKTQPLFPAAEPVSLQLYLSLRGSLRPLRLIDVSIAYEDESLRTIENNMMK